MKSPALLFTLAAGLALPCLGQSLGSYTYAPPYSVGIGNNSRSDPPPLTDVVSVHGLPVTHLLTLDPATLPTPIQKVSGKVVFSFLREWEADTSLFRLVGRPLDPAHPMRVTVSLNPPPLPLDGSAPPPPPPREILILGNANFCEWELLAQNGVVITEALAFTYTSKQTIGSRNP